MIDLLLDMLRQVVMILIVAAFIAGVVLLSACGGSSGAPSDSTGCENMGGERVCKGE